MTWKSVPFDLVGETVNRGDADLAAHLDPWAYSIEKQFNFTKIADTQTGVYQNHTCCVLGANGPFLAANKDPIRRLAEANIEVHEYTANHPDEVAKWYFDTLKPARLKLADLTEILSALVYHEHPIGQPLIDQIRISAEDLKLVKVLEPTTDPKAFAERVTVNLLGLSSVHEQCRPSAGRPRRNEFSPLAARLPAGRLEKRPTGGCSLGCGPPLLRLACRMLSPREVPDCSPRSPQVAQLFFSF